VAWSTIVTGCSPATHGIHGFLLQERGRDLDDRVAGVYAQRCLAEPLWETATLNGLRVVLLRFPMSYPSTMAACRIDGAAGWGGLKCANEVASSGIYDVETGGPVWQGRAPANILLQGLLTIPSLWGKASIRLHVAVTETDEKSLTHLATEPSWDAVVATANGRGWSSPAVIDAEGRYGTTSAAFRFKLLKETDYLRLIITPVHATSGHSHPEESWRRHEEAVGPIEEQCEPDLFLEGKIDLETQMELFRLTTDWTKSMAIRLLREEPWDLFMVHIHHIDWAHHMLQGALDPRHPLFEPASADRYRKALVHAYQMADEVIAAVELSISADDNIIVLGDHGQDLHHTTVHLNQWLEEQGLLRWGDYGRIDWSATKLCVFGNFLYVNQRGRQPSGIVGASDAPRLLSEVTNNLRGLVDPSTGQHPIIHIAPRANLSHMGADGEGMGDLVLFCASGYQLRNVAAPVFVQTRPLHEFTSGHDHFWPLDPRIGTQLFAAGPAFRPGVEARRIHGLEDVAPTVCAALGIEPSLQCEGIPISHILNERKSK
jgi:hypothetical protein